MSASDGGPVAADAPQPGRAAIFESYGRGDATEAAEKIKTSLREHGYDVWIDREHLAPDERDFW